MIRTGLFAIAIFVLIRVPSVDSFALLALAFGLLIAFRTGSIAVTVFQTAYGTFTCK